MSLRPLEHPELGHPYRARVYKRGHTVTYDVYDTTTGATILTDSSGPGWWSRAHDQARAEVHALHHIRTAGYQLTPPTWQHLLDEADTP